MENRRNKNFNATQERCHTNGCLHRYIEKLERENNFIYKFMAFIFLFGIQLTLNSQNKTRTKFSFSQNSLKKSNKTTKSLKLPLNVTAAVFPIQSKHLFKAHHLIIRKNRQFHSANGFLCLLAFNLFTMKNFNRIYYGFLNANLDILELNAWSILLNSFSCIRMHTRCIKSQPWCNAENVFFA